MIFKLLNLEIEEAKVMLDELKETDFDYPTIKNYLGALEEITRKLNSNEALLQSEKLVVLTLLNTEIGYANEELASTEVSDSDKVSIEAELNNLIELRKNFC